MIRIGGQGLIGLPFIPRAASVGGGGSRAVSGGRSIGLGGGVVGPFIGFIPLIGIVPIVKIIRIAVIQVIFRVLGAA